MSKELSEEYKQFIQESGGVVELAKLPIWQFGELAIQFGRALGRREERKDCALLAQSFQIAHCKSHHDDAVDRTAEAIKEAIMDRDCAIEAIPEEV